MHAVSWFSIWGWRDMAPPFGKWVEVLGSRHEDTAAIWEEITPLLRFFSFDPSASSWSWMFFFFLKSNFLCPWDQTTSLESILQHKLGIQKCSSDKRSVNLVIKDLCADMVTVNILRDLSGEAHEKDLWQQILPGESISELDDVGLV